MNEIQKLHPLEQVWQAGGARQQQAQIVFNDGAGEIRVNKKFDDGQGGGDKRKRKPLTRPRGSFIVPSHFAKTASGRSEWTCRLCSVFNLDETPSDWVTLPNKREALEHERGCQIHRKKLTALENFLWEVEDVNWDDTLDTPTLWPDNLSPISDESENDYSWKPACYEELKSCHANARDAPEYTKQLVEFWMNDIEAAGPADPEEFTQPYDPETRADLEKKGLTWKDFFDQLDVSFWNTEDGWGDSAWNNWEADDGCGNGNLQHPNGWPANIDDGWDKDDRGQNAGWDQNGWGVQRETNKPDPDGWIEAKGKVKGKRARTGQRKTPVLKQKQKQKQCTPVVPNFKTVNVYANLQIEVDA